MSTKTVLKKLYTEGYWLAFDSAIIGGRTYHNQIGGEVNERDDGRDTHGTRVFVGKISCIGHEPRLTRVILSDAVELSAVFSEKALVTEVDDRVYLCRSVSVEPKRMSSINCVP